MQDIPDEKGFEPGERDVLKADFVFALQSYCVKHIVFFLKKEPTSYFFTQAIITKKKIYTQKRVKQHKTDFATK